MRKTHVDRLLAGVWLLTLAAICSPPGGLAASSKPEAASGKPERPETHVVGRTALKAKLQLEAIFEAVEMEPVKLTPESWSDLTVVEAVPHGRRVNKGDMLVKIETEKLEEQIAELERERAVSALTLQLAEAEQQNLKQATPLKLEAARRAQKRVSEDYDYFKEIGRTQREKAAGFSIKSALQRLESAAEELAQLEKMYEADDLTEETEEIILKRQRFSVEAAQYFLDSAQLNSERELKTNIPREYETLKAQLLDQELALVLAEETLAKNVEKKAFELEKLKQDRRKARAKLADLKADLEALSIRAPIEGIVYYGACENGKWTTGAAAAKKLVPGGKLSPNEVFITLVNAENMVLKTTIPENELGKAEAGLTGEAVPVSFPETKLPARIEEIGYVPQPGGGFEAKISVADLKGARLMPGMSCKVSFEDIERPAVLAVPKEAVFTEGSQKHVFVAKEQGDPEKRIVKTGDSDEKLIEITEGLSEGDKILLKKPD